MMISRTSRPLVVILLLGAALVLSAHGPRQEASTPDDFATTVLARVGDATIMGADFEAALAALGEQEHQAVLNQPEEFLDVLVARELLYQEAKRSGIEDQPEFQAALEKVKRKLLTTLMATKLRSIEITDDALREYYEANLDRFTTAERISVSHIQVASRDTAEMILAKLADGGDWVELAAEYSTDKETANRGGRIFSLSRGERTEEFEQAAFALEEPGDMTGLVKDADGYHIIKFHEREAMSAYDFESVKESIRQKLTYERGQEQFNEAIAKMRASGRVEIEPKGLDALGSIK